MDYWKSGKYFGVTAHNCFLTVALVEATPVVTPIVTTLPPVSSFGNKQDPAKILLSVQAGIQKANTIFQTQYHATHIQYVEDDEPHETFYKEMVFSLIEQIQNGANLREIKYKYADV